MPADKKTCSESGRRILCLQEVMTDDIPQSMVRSLWNCPYVDWVFLALTGASGGVLVMWDRRVVTKIEEYIGEY